MRRREGAGPGTRGPDARSAGTEWTWFAAVTLLAVGLRFFYFSRVAGAPDIVNPILDSQWNWTQALRIAGGDGLPAEPFWRPPGYEYFLALLLLVSHGSLWFARAVQVVLSGLTAGVVYLLGRRLFGHTAGLVAGLLAAAGQMLIYYSVELLPVTLEVLVNALLLVLLFRAEERGTKRAWFAAGCLLGLSAVIRPTVVGFIVVLFLFVKGLRSWKTGWDRVLPLAAGTALVILPVTGMNAVRGDAVLLAWQGGVNFYIGNSPYADGKTVLLRGSYRPEYSRTLGEYQDQVYLMSRSMAEEEEGRKLRPSEIDRYWYVKTLRAIAADPGRFVSLLGRKTYCFWNAYEGSNNRDIGAFLSTWAPWLKPPLPWFGLIAPLGILGAVLAWRRGRRERILVLFVLSQMAAVVLFFVCARFRMSSVLALTVLAGFAAVWTVGTFRAGRWSRGAAALILVAALMGVAHAGLAGARGVANASLHQFNQALALQREGRFEEAAQVLETVVRMNPQDPTAHSALGTTYLRMDRYEDARRAYAEVIRLQPQMGAIVHSDLGTWLAGKGRLDEAAVELREALRVDPSFVHARLNLAGLLTNAGQPEEALPEFEEVLRLAPDRASQVLPEIAVTLDRLGRHEEALARLREAVEKDRTNVRAHTLLARRLEDAGDREGARREWEAVRQWASSDKDRREAEARLETLR